MLSKAVRVQNKSLIKAAVSFNSSFSSLCPRPRRSHPILFLLYRLEEISHQFQDAVPLPFSIKH